MKTKRKLWKKYLLFLLLFTFALGVSVVSGGSQAEKVQAASVKNGWSQSGSTWYYYRDGKKVKNEWLLYKNKYYFLRSGSGAMAKSQFISWKSEKYYVNSAGIMVTGSQKIKGKWYYFNRPNGDMQTGWKQVNGNWYYFDSKGVKQTGWLNISSGKYYLSGSGKMYTVGWHKIGGRKYYMTATGAVQTGWKTYNGKKYYLRKSGTYKGSAAVGTFTMGSYKRTFNSSGVLVKSVPIVNQDIVKEGELQSPTSSRTIRNYLIHALRPVGTTSYKLGAGDGTDANAAVIPKQMDCSWFVRWTTNQTFKKNVGWVKSTNTAAVYEEWGWGKHYKHSQLKKNNFKGKFKAGDIVNRTGHVWIVIGQCSDGSYVLVHTSPPCTQIAGTPSPDDPYNGNSQAIALAQQYMTRYYQSTLDKYSIPQQNTWATDTAGYLTASDVTSFRWSQKTLSDPEGLTSMSASEILENLYGE